MTKILYVIDHLGGGGAENQFVELVKRVAQNPDVEVRCFLTEGQGIRYKGLVDEGMEVITCQKPSEGRSTLRAIRQMRTLIDDFRPDVLHTFLMYSTFVSTLAVKGQWRPPLFLTTEYSSPEKILKEVNLTFLKRMLLKWAYGSIDVLTTESAAVRDELSDTRYMPLEKIRIVPAGLDLSLCRPEDREQARWKTGLPLDSRVISIVGALVERKGHLFLLDAFSSVLKDMDDLVLYIVGEGPFRKGLETKVKELGIEKNVVFTGYRNDAKHIIAASDVFCLPSLYEGMPNVVMESMALGTPVITTARYGALDLITHGESGMLVEPGDVEAIAVSLRTLLSDKDVYAKVIHNAREKIQGYDFSVMAARYLKIYKEYIG